MQDRRAVRASAVIKTGTTSSRIPIPAQSTVITPRKSLSQEEINRRNNHAALKTKDFTMQETIQLNEPLLDEEEPKCSKKSEVQFGLLMVFAGFALMTFLFIVSQYGYALAVYDIEHFKYGQDPMTHISGRFGLSGETKSKQSYAAALNQNGSITVVIIPPDTSETRVYVLTSYQNLSNDVIPYITQDKFNQTLAIKVTVGDMQWYLIKRGNAFVQAQM